VAGIVDPETDRIRLIVALEPVLPDPTRFLGVHGLTFDAFERVTERLEVLDGAIHAHLSRWTRLG
jgi:hypothetical protein